MKGLYGWSIPDYDDNLRQQNIVDVPSFAGRGTYQFYAFRRLVAIARDFRHGVDIGAHVGTWSYAMSRCFAKVTAFEPVPSHVECWRKNMAEEKNAELIEVALGDRWATMNMVTKPPVSLKARIESDEDRKLPRYSVRVQQLDDYHLEQVDLIKIDTEGFEVFVCRGGEETIRRCRPLILVEQKPKNVSRYGIDPIAAVTLLQSWGARIVFEIRDDYCLEFPS
jgi:FkbM family methyltransferase